MNVIPIGLTRGSRINQYAMIVAGMAAYRYYCPVSECITFNEFNEELILGGLPPVGPGLFDDIMKRAEQHLEHYIAGIRKLCDEPVAGRALG